MQALCGKFSVIVYFEIELKIAVFTTPSRMSVLSELLELLFAVGHVRWMVVLLFLPKVDTVGSTLRKDRWTLGPSQSVNTCVLGGIS